LKNKIILIVIYIAFISLGLPDSILGTAWPSMRSTLGLPIEAAGIFISITTLCTAISSFISGHVISRLGTGRVTFVSCVLTGAVLLGYSIAPSYIWFIILTVPFGFGAGAVDTGLNNYVAKHYSSRHMSWLHCFWGVGASLGPVIMTFAITQLNNRRVGYRSIGIIQLSLSIILLLSLPLWKEKESQQQGITSKKDGSRLNILQNRGVLLSIIAFPLYIGVEAGTGVWMGSLLVEGRGIGQAAAGICISLFYASIMAGRFVSGFLTVKFTNSKMIRAGLMVAIAGTFILILPIKAFILPGIILIGLGCAPVFPCMVHETPRRFGDSLSGIITGYQVGMAYLSGVAIIPIIGLLAGRISLEAIPFGILFFAVLTLVCTERLNKISGS
jgi:fucose permease